MNILVGYLKNNTQAVVPIAIIVLVLHFTLVPLNVPVVLRFLVGAITLIVGLSIFFVGVDIGISPFGTTTGSALVKTNKLWLFLLGGGLLGFFVSMAEPGLVVLVNQIEYVTAGGISARMLLAVIPAGFAFMIALGFARVFLHLSMRLFFAVAYGLVLVLAWLTSRSSPEFLAIAFDSSGSVTGILVVPFIMALAVGISRMRKDSKQAEEDSFGLIGAGAVGPILAVMIMNLVKPVREYPLITLEPAQAELGAVMAPFWGVTPAAVRDSFIALLPLAVSFLVLQRVLFKLDERQFRRILKGFLYTLLGTFLFFMGVNGGFMELGGELGFHLASLDNKVWLLAISFILGFVTIAAEPSVYVLTRQIEDVTSGYVKRTVVVAALALGVGTAIFLSSLRILVPGLTLWHILLPGYAIALILARFVPSLFVGMGFDAGSVATGPLTTTFILAFTQGAAGAFEGADLLRDGLGMIALVAMAGIVTMLALGVVFRAKSS
ncbi:MAG: DUF1538 domain-containing protein [Limnochordia bacterium]|mgnify:CR=1 FL=1|nr:DUF1538 domain-containing protein [Bacillota bacterium]NLL07794.1 DUF1538 domain-containing protein [Bacillota bacterium]